MSDPKFLVQSKSAESNFHDCTLKREGHFRTLEKCRSTRPKRVLSTFFHISRTFSNKRSFFMRVQSDFRPGVEKKNWFYMNFATGLA